jgi:glutamate formiminotransferase/formiminotetrahydrofolate cyclodeaminase
MVGNLTVGKKGYEASWAELSGLAVKAQGLKDRLLRAVEEDTEAFNGIMDAMKLPKASPEEKAAREAALQDAYRTASLVPFETASACFEAISLAQAAAEKGNVNSVSDAGVAALMARAGVEGAALNVLINLASVTDLPFASDLRARAESLVSRSESEAAAVLERVRSAIKA